MSWTNGSWSQDDSIMSGYPYPNDSIYATIPFNIQEVYVPFIFDKPSYELYPYVFCYPIPFNIKQVYTSLFITQGVNFGYASPVIYDPPRLGAFASTSSLQDVTISPSVIELGDFTFDKSSISEVEIAPDCIFNPESTFPENCEVKYYDSDLLIISNWAEWKYVSSKFKWEWVDVNPVILFNSKSIVSNLKDALLTVYGNNDIVERDIKDKCKFFIDELTESSGTVYARLKTSDLLLTIDSNIINWIDVDTFWSMDDIQKRIYFGFPHACSLATYDIEN